MPWVCRRSRRLISQAPSSPTREDRRGGQRDRRQPVGERVRWIALDGDADARPARRSGRCRRRRHRHDGAHRRAERAGVLLGERPPAGRRADVADEPPRRSRRGWGASSGSGPGAITITKSVRESRRTCSAYGWSVRGGSGGRQRGRRTVRGVGHRSRHGERPVPRSVGLGTSGVGVGERDRTDDDDQHDEHLQERRSAARRCCRPRDTSPRVRGTAGRRLPVRELNEHKRDRSHRGHRCSHGALAGMPTMAATEDQSRQRATAAPARTQRRDRTHYLYLAVIVAVVARHRRRAASPPTSPSSSSRSAPASST